jgi:hypothetical protein
VGILGLRFVMGYIIAADVNSPKSGRGAVPFLLKKSCRSPLCFGWCAMSSQPKMKLDAILILSLAGCSIVSEDY